jgi:hypothetical protein
MGFLMGLLAPALSLTINTLLFICYGQQLKTILPMFFLIFIKIGMVVIVEKNY